jgi:hypothetical protein
MTAMRRWEAFDDPSAMQDRLTYQDSRSMPVVGREFQQPGADVVAPVWLSRVDNTEREDTRAAVEPAGRDSGQFRRPFTVAERVIEDAVEAACEGGTPRVVPPGSAPHGGSGQ